MASFLCYLMRDEIDIDYFPTGVGLIFGNHTIPVWTMSYVFFDFGMFLYYKFYELCNYVSPIYCLL